MITRCAWCPPPPTPDAEPVSHGLCAPCLTRFFPDLAATVNARTYVPGEYLG